MTQPDHTTGSPASPVEHQDGPEPAPLADTPDIANRYQRLPEPPQHGHRATMHSPVSGLELTSTENKAKSQFMHPRSDSDPDTHPVSGTILQKRG